MIELIGKLKTTPESARVLIDSSFVVKLIDSFHSEDELEKGYLRTLVVCIYSEFPNHRNLIRNRLFDELRKFKDRSSVMHSGNPHLLFSLGIILKELDFSDLKAEFGSSGEFPLRVLIPLFPSKWILMFYPELTDCILEFVHKNPKIADKVIMGILKIWPAAAGDPKDCIFLDAVAGVLERMSALALEQALAPLLEKIRCCLSSPVFMVVRRALKLMERVARLAVVARLPMDPHVRAELPVVLSGLVKVAMKSWEVKGRVLAKKVLGKYGFKLIRNLTSPNVKSI